MKDRSLYIDCFKVDKEKSVELYTEWSNTVRGKRDEILQGMLDKTGAIAWRERNSWGDNCTKISDLVFPADSDLASASHIKINDSATYEGQNVFCLRGKMNSKAGKEFNKSIDEANESLKGLLDFSGWITERFKIGRTGLGHSTGRGTAMISTSVGYYKGVIIATVPNDRCDRASEKPDMPDFFEPITYGQLHDLQHSDS